MRMNPLMSFWNSIRHRSDSRDQLWLRGSIFGLAVVILWDVFGSDLSLAALMGGRGGFPLRDSTWLVVPLHTGARLVAWAVLLSLVVGIRYPIGPLKSLSFHARVQLPVGVLICLLTVASVKYFSTTSCPWDLQEFGGTVPYVWHWTLRVSDGGGGRCFPAGHASTGFAFLAGYFVLAQHQSRLASLWFATAVFAGLALGASQQFRGAHFASHTLWTAWICWAVGGAVDALFRRWRTFRLRVL